MTAEQTPKKTASQRLDDMENSLMALYQTADNMARDLITIKEAVKLLGNKLDSVVKATNRGEQLNDETISKIMVENNVSELKNKVDSLVQQKILSPAEEVTDNSFVVGQEIDADGNIQNPRLQFVVSALEKETRTKFVGAKVGQTLDLQEGKWKFIVTEVYKVETPTTDESAS